jgi:hypothetical protein
MREHATSDSDRPARLAGLEEGRRAAQRLGVECVQRDRTGAWRPAGRARPSAGVQRAAPQPPRQPDPRLSAQRLETARRRVRLADLGQDLALDQAVGALRRRRARR